MVLGQLLKRIPVNFLSRVASNLKNGRYGQKMEDGQDHGQIIRDTRGWHYGVIVIVCRSLDFCRGWGNRERFKNCTRIIERFTGIAGSCTAISKSLKETVRSCTATSKAARATQRSPRIERKFAAFGERSRAIGTRSERITGNAAATNASCDAIPAIVKRAIRLYFRFHGCRLLMEWQPSLGFRTWYNHA